MPNRSGQNIFAAYEINMFNQSGMNFMWNGGRNGGYMQFGNNIDLTLGYTQEQLDFYGLTENEIKVKYWDSSLQSWATLNNNVTVDKTNNTVSFSSNSVSNFYVLSDGSVTDVNAATEIPADFTLNQNYPNPFNPSTTISYTLPVSGYTTLKVYDILGREIATLVNELKQAGNYSVEFGTQLARQGGSSELPSGIYFYKLESGNYTSTRKMILMK
ncbi:MAG: T9SS type A sorting domain-containing protein [Ignavibacteriales bacterium]|nr:T9SS type A sorting domain-containing protein [Ignavibacteriales bacterium]